MNFAYQAINSTGGEVSETIEADDMGEAIETLRRQGLYVSQIAPASEGRASRKSAGNRSSWWKVGPLSGNLSRGKKLKNLALFTRQLAVLVSSGTPLTQALGSLERQAREKPWRDVLTRLRNKVEEGATLSDAMNAQPEIFDPICRSLIAAGESGGSFDQMLERLASLSRKQMQIRSAIAGAMVYPCLLIFIAINVMCTMMLFVLPRFVGLFESLEVQLPPNTRVLIAISNGMRNYWWAILPGLGIGALAIKTWIGTPSARETMDGVMLRLPMTGKIIRSFAVARITRVLGVLLVGKVPLLDALALARQTARNSRYAALVASAEQAVERGSTISTAFANSTLIDPSIVEAIRSGENSGQLAPLLLSISEFLDEDNDVVIKSLTSIIEPLILIVLGVVVGFVAMSLFMPLFDLTAAVQQGGH